MQAFQVAEKDIRYSINSDMICGKSRNVSGSHHCSQLNPLQTNDNMIWLAGNAATIAVPIIPRSPNRVIRTSFSILRTQKMTGHDQSGKVKSMWLMTLLFGSWLTLTVQHWSWPSDDSITRSESMIDDWSVLCTKVIWPYLVPFKPVFEIWNV